MVVDTRIELVTPAMSRDPGGFCGILMYVAGL